MLIDDVTITIKAGNGGNGCAALKRNAMTAKGGPDGGNGGNGGAVYLQGVNDILGLRDFQFKKELFAEDGVRGGKQNLYGRNGKDIIIPLPIGTLVTDVNSEDTWEIANATDKILIAMGGHGGRGNNEFKSATNQTPRYAEPGQPGEERVLHLKLRIIADIGLVGLPNAGKSSLLNEVTNANPKIGNYAFTTLEPNIGVLVTEDKQEKTIILADIPGLIEGASEGKGLGTKFLRHVEKTNLLLHCIDSTSQNVLETYHVVRKEIENYEIEMKDKPEIILLTKIDMVTSEELQLKRNELKSTQKNILTVSIYDEGSLRKLKDTILALTQK